MPPTDNVVFMMDVMEFSDEYARGPKYKYGYQRPSLNPKNVHVDLHRETVTFNPTEDWHLEAGQPWAVEVWRSGVSTGIQVTFARAESEEQHHHAQATMKLQDMLNAFRNSCNYIRILRR